MNLMKAGRASMKEDLLRFNNRQKFVVFDFETCSLNLASKNNALATRIYCISHKKIEEHNYFIKWENYPYPMKLKKLQISTKQNIKNGR